MGTHPPLTLAEQKGDVVWVTFNRPGDRNSLNTPLMKELDRVLSKTENSRARAIVFTGAGETFFSGGADAVEMIRYDAAGALAFSERIQSLFNRFENSPLVLVAAMNGLAYGGGFELALACDFRIAADTARMGLPEVRVGIIPGGGGTQRLSAVVGKGRAMEIILGGRLYSAQEALAIGMIHRVTPKNDLSSSVENFLRPLFKNPQYALSRAKAAVQACQYLTFTEGLEAERAQFKKCFRESFFVTEITRQIRSGQMPTTASR